MGKKSMAVCRRIYEDIRTYGVGILVALLVLAGCNILVGQFCPLVLLTGIPCPACGLSRAGGLLLTLHWKQAFYMHPMIFPIAAFLLYCCWYRYVWGKTPKYMKTLLFSILLLLIVVYFCRMGWYFKPPYLVKGRSVTPIYYEPRNLFRACLHMVSKMIE